MPLQHELKTRRSPQEAEIPGNAYEGFLRLLTQNQLKIMLYLWSLVHDRTAVQDVYQETVLALWKRFPDYDPELSFSPWALGIARNQVLKYFREHHRDRLVFREEILTQLADEGMEIADEADARRLALSECLTQLPGRQRELVQQFYEEGKAAGQIALLWGRSVHAVYKSLKVLRRNLLDCVEQKLAKKFS